MNGVRFFIRSVLAAIFLLTICYGSEDLRLTYKIPRSSYSGLADGRERAIMFPRSISIPVLDDQNRNLVDFINQMQQQLNGSPRRHRSYENDHEMDLDAEKDILQQILQNDNALGKLPYFYNNLIESHDKVADSVQKYSDNDFTKRDNLNKTDKGHQTPSNLGPGHGEQVSPPKDSVPLKFNGPQSLEDLLLSEALRIAIGFPPK
ncbi:unnamed protein product [Arctia plantaginis]|uniref:Uncharacterized protein n=1 Tax=Arctia plantaginis TaxID=874455 RepID=A0A8S1AEL5_ARCPL|nr:unnamed protein product [Arctia plantaginis]